MIEEGRVVSERDFERGDWALILGGSSGFGLATARKLAAHGMSLCLVHRDRRATLRQLEPELERLRRSGVPVLALNVDALDPARRRETLECLAQELGPDGRVRVLLHSIAFGNLKPLAPERDSDAERSASCEALAKALGVAPDEVRTAAARLLESGHDAVHLLAPRPAAARAVLGESDLAHTLHAMGTSLVGWTQEVLARGLFARDARVFGLTSEGNTVAWRGYAAVAAAKCALESVARALAVELAPYGVRANVLQPGVTDTPALAAIPGNAHLKAQARLRNPFRRLTTPEDVANLVYLLCLPEAAWLNGEVIRVDGGEHVSGVLA